MNRKDTNQTYYATTYDVYVGNVPKNINEVDLKQLFLKYGEIKQVLCRWKEDYFGYGIIKFLYKPDADRVLQETEEVTLNGHTMPVKAARRSDHSHQNGNVPLEIKQSVYQEMSKHPIYSGPQFSNTDYGYFQPPKYPDERSVYPQPMMLEVHCTSVEDSITFYGCPVNRSEELMLVENALRSLHFNHKRLDRRPCPKKVYAALFSEDNSWYRCSLIRSALPNKSGMCTVRYIDYGNQEDISYKNLVELPDSLQKLPPFASKFIFSHLECENKSPNKKSYLHQLINKRMTLCAFLSPTMEYQVVKCSCNGKDVITETLNKGFAKVQRSIPSKMLKNEKPKAYAYGSEIRLFKKNSDAKNVTDNKMPEAETDSKILNRNACKIKDTMKKSNEVYCNGITECTKTPEFHPKIIIKRGSELRDIVGSSISSSVLEKKDSQDQLFPCTMEGILANLKLINNIRSLVSQSSDDSIINNAASLLREEMVTLVETENSNKSAENAITEYKEAMDKILCSTSETELSMLKSNRDSCRNTLCDKLKEYLGSCDSSIFERRERIQTTIMDLASNSNAWMNLQLNAKPASIHDLVADYSKVKEERWNMVYKTREKTNQRHKHFMDIFTDLQKAFHLNTDENNETDLNLNSTEVGKATSYSEKLNEALQDFGKALEEEIKMLTLTKHENNMTVITCLLSFLDVHKEKVDHVCELYENRFSLYNQLSKVPRVESTLAELIVNEKEIQELSSSIDSFKNSSNENEDSRQDELHMQMKKLHQMLLQEDYLKEILSKAAESHFPELRIEHPELKLFQSAKNRSLLKPWKPEYFVGLKVGTRGTSSFASFLQDELIDIKDYTFGSPEEMETFIQKAISWNEAKSDYLIKIKAMFPKDEKTLTVLLPPVAKMLLDCVPVPSPTEGEKACRYMRQVLIGLRDLHSKGFLHRSVHPKTVLIDNDKVFLDFCYDSTYLDGNSTLKGINFQSSSENKTMHQSEDMYSFGCLVLWVLFPNLSFTSTSEGVPNLAAFRSIVEELILPKDYALLSALVDSKPERRPSSSTLLNKGFLSKYEAYCRTRCDNQKKV